MNGKKLTKIIAVCMACLGVGVLTFTGCKKKPDSSDGSQTGNTQQGGGSTGDNTGIDESKPPVISGPVQGGPTITKASAGELETAYVQWTAASNAKWYNVYYSEAGANKWTKLDAPLVRQYKTYFRADAVGLKAGTYDMKVVPVQGDDTEATKYAATATGIGVKAHDRSGYAFVNNSSKATASGAYNPDGTLREGVIVLYVTAQNFATVSVKVGSATVTGLDNILGEGYQEKKGATNPLCVRIIGSLGNETNGLSTKANGDLEIKGVSQGVTVEGIGNDATANGWGFHISSSSNVEIRNIALMNSIGGTKDGIGFESKCSHVWVHNCDFYYGANAGGDQKKGDGALDTKSCTYVTHSYNRFWDSGKCNLQGMKSEVTTNYITYHHNWYDHSDSRHPRIRTCTVHIYNNYFDGNAKYGVGVTMGASAFVENNYFRSTATMRPMLSSMQGTDALGAGTFSGEDGGMIKAFGNKFDCSASNLKLITQKTTSDVKNLDCYEASSRDEKVPETYLTKQGTSTYSNFDTAADMYKYTVQSADEAKASVERYAGRVDHGDLSFDFDDATQDGNYDLIPELSKLLTDYSKTLTLVKVGDIGGTTGGSTEGGGSTGGTTGGAVSGDIDKVEFKRGTTYPAGITVTGNYKSGTDYLKMESATKVTITVSEAKKIKIHSNTPSVKIKLNGTKVTLDANGETVFDLGAGETLTITKGDSMELQYIQFI